MYCNVQHNPNELIRQLPIEREQGRITRLARLRSQVSVKGRMIKRITSVSELPLSLEPRQLLDGNFPEDVWIYDLGSVAGVYIDRKRIKRKVFLEGVTHITMGTTSFLVSPKAGFLT